MTKLKSRKTPRKTRSFKRYRGMLDELGITQNGASRFLDVGERTSRRWATDDAGELPLAVIMLLAIMIEDGIDPARARALAGEPLKRGVTLSDRRRAE